MPPDNGWNEHKLFVLDQLRDNKDDHAEMKRSLRKIEKEVMTLKPKVAIVIFIATAVLYSIFRLAERAL